jgi:hypothetical protein
MEKPAFTETGLSDVKVITTTLRVHVEELLCQVKTRWISVLKYLLSDVSGRIWSCHVVPHIKCHRFLRTQL